MILLIYFVLIVVICNNVTVIWQTIKVSQTETILLILIINRYERRNHISFLERILRLTAIGIFEIHIGIQIYDALGSMEFHTCDIMTMLVADKDTLLVGMVVRYRILCLITTSAEADHIVLCQSVALDSILPIGIHTSFMGNIGR